MFKNVLLLAAVTFLAGLPCPALAEEMQPEMTAESKAAAIEAHKAELRAQKAPLIEAYKAELRASKSAMIDTYRAQLQQQKTLTDQQRVQFKSNLQTIQDEKKRAIVLKLDTRIATIGAQRTSNMSSVLTKLQTILTSLTEKAATAKTAGADTTTVDLAIVDATTAIASAEAAVAAQSATSYIIPVTNETTLVGNVGTTMKKFQTDMRTTHAAVVNAKQAVMKVVSALKQVMPREEVAQ